jgi:hypothetical protein
MPLWIRIRPSNAASDSAITLCRKSWTAYIGIAIRVLLLIGLSVTAIYWQPSYWEIAAVILLALIFIGYQIALLRSYRLYYDESGVWLYSGILPWKRSVPGVKWRDLDEAIFVNNFWSWISGSYTVQLRHRFTKAIEISAAAWRAAKQAVLASTSNISNTFAPNSRSGRCRRPR